MFDDGNDFGIEIKTQTFLATANVIYYKLIVQIFLFKHHKDFELLLTFLRIPYVFLLNVLRNSFDFYTISFNLQQEVI